MWAIRTIGWTLASILTLTFFGLHWLELFIWVCDFYAAISILSLLIRAGVNAKNRYAIWIDDHSPKIIHQLGMLMSQTIMVRFMFWGALIVIGYQSRDVQAYRELVQRPNIHWKIIRTYQEPHYNRVAYDLQTSSGQIVENFIPCEKMGWYEGQVLTEAAYYNRGECMSFSGPRAHWTVEPYQEDKGQSHEQQPSPESAR